MREIQQRLTSKAKVKYSYGPYSRVKGDEQWIRLTEGCPWNCPYCYEPQEIKIFPFPEIKRNKVGIMDMNLLCKPEAKDILRKLSEVRVDGKVVHYDLLCGIDYRFLTPEIAQLLRDARVDKIRFAWDWYFKDQRDIKKAVDVLKEVGYNNRSLMVFMICNWKIPVSENLMKLDLLKVWNVQVADCYYDNQVGPKFIPIYWTLPEIREFRQKCRKHNQLVNFGIDPEIK